MAEYTTRKLINEAYYLTGITSRGLETVDGQEVNDGLELLNNFIAVKSADIGLIPYYNELIFNAVAGQQEYFLENMLEIETFTFNIGPVRYPTMEVSRETFFGSGRVDNIVSLPYQWHQERRFNGVDLFVYFLPQDSSWVFKVWGKFALQSLTLNQILTASIDKFYIQYLKYGLAEYICEFYNIVTPMSIVNRTAQYEQIVRDISPLDLTMIKATAFNLEGGFNYGDVNIGRGWRPVR